MSEGTSALSISYGSDSDLPYERFTENYIADAQVHMGDGNYTGDVYTASCSNSQITIVRNFKQLLGPLDTLFVLNGDELDFTSAVEGDSSQALVENFSRE